MKSTASDLESTSQMSRKRPRLLDEALSQDERVDLRFSDSFASDNENLLLLQVPESLLGEIGEDADQGLVKLIGGQEQDAVLVTGTQTFKLTRAETSNTLLLVPPEGTCVSTEPTSPVKRGVSCGVPRGSFDAVAAVGFQYEISKIAPSLEQIREILEACVYRGKDEEKSINPELLDMCSLEELQKRVQFSQRELRAGLHELDALPIQGRWRMVDPGLMERTADKLLSAIVEDDMPLEKINPKAVIEALPSCEALVLEHCLRTYSSCSRDDDFGASTREYQLDLNKVARLRADQILRAREQECARDGRPLLLSDFMEQWAASMPGVETPDHDLLKGIGLIERKRGDNNNATVIYVPASGLPFPPAERLSALFRIKPKWPMSELESYISEADRKAGFLLKNTRVSTDPATGQKLFSAR